MQNTTHVLRATEILKAEHEVILTILDCLERVATDAAGSRAIDVDAARQILDFLGTFADRCHHGKEEDHLFPMLIRKGLPRGVGPIAVMLDEHDRGRAEVAELRAALDAHERQDAGAAVRFGEHARAYVQLLREHIAKENDVLFPMADGMLAEVDQATLLEAFGDVEAHDLGSGTHERYLALVEGLVRRLGVTPSGRALPHSGGCCGHSSGCS